jgi:hypothetical protein
VWIIIITSHEWMVVQNSLNYYGWALIQLHITQGEVSATDIEQIGGFETKGPGFNTKNWTITYSTCCVGWAKYLRPMHVIWNELVMWDAAFLELSGDTRYYIEFSGRWQRSVTPESILKCLPGR